MNEQWINVTERLPQEGTTVLTKIHEPGTYDRNVQALKRIGNLWFYPDGSMYVYYTPTHWRSL